MAEEDKPIDQPSDATESDVPADMPEPAKANGDEAKELDAPAPEVVDAEVVSASPIGAPRQPMLPLSVRIAVSVACAFLVLYGALMVVTLSMDAYAYRDDGSFVANDAGGLLEFTFTDEECLFASPCIGLVSGATIAFYVDGELLTENNTNDLGEATLNLPYGGGELLVSANNQTWLGEVLIRDGVAWPLTIDAGQESDLGFIGVDPVRAKQGLYFVPVGAIMFVGGAAGFARRYYPVALGGAALTLAAGVISLINPFAPPAWILFGGLGVWGLMRAKHTFKDQIA